MRIVGAYGKNSAGEDIIFLGKKYSYLFRNVSNGMPVYAKISSAPPRSDFQNDKLHPVIRDVQRQVEWEGEKQPLWKWKRLFVASLFKHLYEDDERFLMGLDGEDIDMTKSTSELTVEECGALIELVYMFGDKHGVEWSEPKE